MRLRDLDLKNVKATPAIKHWRAFNLLWLSSRTILKSIFVIDIYIFPHTYEHPESLCQERFYHIEEVFIEETQSFLAFFLSPR